MNRVKACRQCGVPRGIGKDVIWHDNGVITHAKNPGHRLVFYESDCLDEIFEGIEELIEIPIEHIIIESKRRATRTYIENQIPPFRRKILNRYGPKTLSRRIRLMAVNYGYGDIALEGIRNTGDEDDFQSVCVTHPYSLPLFCGDSLGTKEAMDGRDFYVSWEQTGDHTYLVTSRVGRHPIALGERLGRKPCGYRPGDIALERCASCGVPLRVARCRWNVENGTIMDPGTGRRMAFFNPDSIQVVLDDLELELGEMIAEAIIEAQRRFVRRILGKGDILPRRDSYREMVALRGLGYLKSMDFERRHCAAVLENACLPLFMVGTVKALYEMGSESESVDHRWEMLPDGVLVVELHA
ncbi:MAG: hypothetical protein JW854_14885 [Actinobacteria bacterium]|nr:hypothetical protein [Actinomycetota bacterium]